MSKVRLWIRQIPFAIAALLASLLTLGLWAISNLPFWACVLMAIGACIVNSALLSWEDSRPGGFDDPHPREKSAERPDK
ncbi:hypothetical protein [Roseateles sp.]|uniref:hypothetical protein n=1 Tax=Roseateles sp. TaxID=1971397 RepID=UPI00394ADAFC